MAKIKYTAEQRERCIVLRRHTLMTYAQIAREVGCSPNFVQLSCADLVNQAKLEHSIKEKMECARRVIAHERKNREIARLLANAKPDGSHCIEKACPYEALVDGRCRRHFIDSRSDSSLLKSTMVLLG
jgi:transposase-like protein